MSIEIRALRHFAMLCELGTFARAADALHLSQPALTRSIQALERRIGTPLVLRSSTGITPTDVGRVLALRAREILQLSEDLGRDLQLKGTLQSGQVAVGAGPYPAETTFVMALTRFVEAHPMVKVRLQVRAWDELLGRLRSRELDFFVAEISTMLREPDLVIEPLDEHPLYFAVRSDHPLAGSRGFSLTDVFDYPFVSMSRISPRILQPIMAAQRKAAGRLPPSHPFPAIESAPLAALKRMVAASDVIIAVPLPCIAEELEDGRIHLLGSEPWLKLAYGVVTLKSHPMSAAATRLRELIRDAELALSIQEQHLMERWRPRADARAGGPAARAASRRN